VNEIDIDLAPQSAAQKSIMGSTDTTTNFSIAHALLRFGLGVNILMHGVSRLPNLQVFVQHTVQTMSKTWLPVPLLAATGFAIPFAELLLGGLLVIGFLTRPALIAGLLLMIVLTFGVCLAQDWPVASDQLIYMLVYAALLAFLPYDSYSLDHLIFGQRSRAT
jgi:thiosulfate dehydrogenase [quinone] large subunit